MMTTRTGQEAELTAGLIPSGSTPGGESSLPAQGTPTPQNFAAAASHTLHTKFFHFQNAIGAFNVSSD